MSDRIAYVRFAQAVMRPDDQSDATYHFEDGTYSIELRARPYPHIHVQPRHVSRMAKTVPEACYPLHTVATWYPWCKPCANEGCKLPVYSEDDTVCGRQCAGTAKKATRSAAE